MPRLTVVLVGGDEASEASARSQRFAGAEIVTTPDRSAAARNAAIDAATGEYVWFVEPGDLLLPGSLARVARSIEALAPDVIVVHHSTIDATGRSHEGRHGPLLSRLAGAAHRLEERPGLTDTAPRAWNKVLRREHVLAAGARFSVGELTLTWPALLAAERIATVPETSYVRTGSYLGSPFDVFEQYDAVMADAGAPELVVPAMVRHELELLRRRVPPGDRRAFFRRMSEGYTRHRTGRERLPTGRVGRLRWKLVEHDAYAAFRAVEASRGRRGTVVRLRRRARSRARKQALERYYRERLRQPIDPGLAVYAAYWFRGYSCNPRAVYERARELVPEVRGVWVVKPGAAKTMPSDVDYVLPNTREYYDVIARAGTFVNNVNFPDHLVKREGTVHVQTHHGTPLKHMGLDLRDTHVAGRRMDFEALAARVGRWDFSVSQNPHTTRIWERVYPGTYETLEVGYPRNDVLASATEADVERVRRDLGIEPGQIAVLYTPTHREYQPGYVPVLDLARVADALGQDHVVLARLHYFYDGDPLLRDLHRAGRIRDVASHPSIEGLCLAADVLVTDYSSIMFDYAVLDRPIVIHAPDWEVYRAVRGAYFDLLTEGPGVVTRSEDELVAALRAPGDEAAAKRAAFRARFCALDDGRAAERVVRRVWLSDRETPAPAVASGAR